MNKIKAIIVDDEFHARAAICGILKENFHHVEIVGEAKDVPEAVKLILSEKPDIVFLDIEMPGHSGLELLDFFPKGELNFDIIFVTAYNEFALNAFELSAIDYLIKPVQLKDIERSLAKLHHGVQHYNVLKDNLNEKGIKRILVNTNLGSIFIPLNEIIYIKADGSYSDIVLIDNRKYCVTKRLSDFERIIEFGDFMRIHRSQIINLNQIQRISKIEDGSVIMTDGTELAITKEKRIELEELIKHFRI